MQEKHAEELTVYESKTADQPNMEKPKDNQTPDSNGTEESIDKSAEKAEKKRQKNLLKKQKAREAEKQRELQIQEDLANAGPSARVVESDRMKELYLDPNKLHIVEVPADGHCLYRAVAAQCDEDIDYRGIRKWNSWGVTHTLALFCVCFELRNSQILILHAELLFLQPCFCFASSTPSGGICADTLSSHAEEFAPFAEFDDSYEAYVGRVRSSADWGGQLELRALSQALHRRIVVYSANAPPLTMGCDIATEDEPIRVSYHKHYYALGEHYNCVVPT